MASSFLQKKAEKRAEKIDREWGADAYGGSNWRKARTGTAGLLLGREEAGAADPGSSFLQRKAALQQAEKAEEAAKRGSLAAMGRMGEWRAEQQAPTGDAHNKRGAGESDGLTLSGGAPKEESGLQMSLENVAERAQYGGIDRESRDSLVRQNWQLRQLREDSSVAAAEAQNAKDEVRRLSGQLQENPSLAGNGNFTTRLAISSGKERAAAEKAAALKQQEKTAEQRIWSRLQEARYGELEAAPGYAAFSTPVEANAGRDALWQAMNPQAGDVNLRNRKYRAVTEEERALYNYLYNTRGAEAAERYVDDALGPELNRREYEADQAEIADMTKKFGAGAALNVASVPLKVLGGTVGAADLALQNLRKDISGSSRPIDYYSPGMQVGTAGSDIRGAVVDNIEEGIGGTLGKVAGFLYQTGMSIADSWLTAGLARVGVPAATALLGGSAATDEAKAAKERGASDRQALASGLAAGAAEMIFEKVSIDRLLEPSGARNLRGVLLNALQQGGVEASEEVATTIANALTDGWINGGRSEFESRRDAYLRAGESDRRAAELAWRDFAVELGASALGGFLSGGVSGGARGGMDLLRGHGAAEAQRPGLALGGVQEAAERPQRGAEQRQGLVLPEQRNAAEAAQWVTGTVSDAGTERDKVQMENDAIVTQLRNNSAAIGAMEPVVKLDGTEFRKSEVKLSDQVANFFGRFGNKVFRRGLGEVIVDMRGVKADIAHGLGRAKAITFAAVPHVIERGIQIGYVENWQKEGQNSYVFAAPVQIGTRTGHVGVVVLQEKDNRYYLHEVIDANGDLIYIRENAPDHIKTGVAVQDGVTGGSEASSSASVLPGSGNVKRDLANSGLVLGGAREAAVEPSGLVLGGAQEALQGDMHTGTRRRVNAEGAPVGKSEQSSDMGGMQNEQTEAGREQGYAGDYRRQNRVGADVAGGSVSRRAARQQQAQRVRAEGIRTAVTDEGVTATSAAAQGIQGGTERNSIAIVPEHLQPRQLRRTVQEYRQRGIEVVPFVGSLEMQAGKDTFWARGAVSADGRKIWVRADHNTLGWEKILDHEDFHRRVQSDAALLADTKARLAADYGEAELRAIAEDYVQAYGFTDMSMEEVLEEVLSDYYAGIDVFAGTEDAQSDLGKRGELVRDVTRERGDRAAAQESGARFSQELPPDAVKYSGRSMTEDSEIYSYDFLTSLQDMTPTVLPELNTLTDEDGRFTRRDIVNAGMKNARSVGTERDGSVFVENMYTGHELRIDSDSIRHGLMGDKTRLLTNARIGSIIGDVVQSAVPVNGLTSTSAAANGTYAMAAYIVDKEGREYVAIVTVEQRDNAVINVDVVHAVNGRKRKGDRLGTKPQGFPSTIARIKVADFLEIVNQTFQSILSEDVFQRLNPGQKKNEAGYYTERALFSRELPQGSESIIPYAERESRSEGGTRTRRGKVSKVRSNTYERSGLYSEVEKVMEGLRPEDMTYDPISEKTSMSHARARLEADFRGEAAQLAEKDAWSGEDLDTAMGILYEFRQAARLSGDYSKVIEWSKRIQEKGTRSGQMIQAFAKYTRTASGVAAKAAETLQEIAGTVTPNEQQKLDAVTEQVETVLQEETGAAANAVIDNLAPGRTGRGGRGGGNTAGGASGEISGEVLSVLEEVYRQFRLRKARDHGPKVEDWTRLTGEELARILGRRAQEPGKRKKTTMQTILDDLLRFSEEHALPKRKAGAGEKRTAVARIADYLHNREAYAEAWAAAQKTLRAQYENEPEKLELFEGWLGSTIGYNADPLHFDRVMFDAILETAEELGVDRKKIEDLGALGVTDSTVQSIADAFVDAVGVSGEDAGLLRDAVARHVQGILRSAVKPSGLRVSEMVNKAAAELDQKLKDLLVKSGREKNAACGEIVDYLINELGIQGTDAFVAADAITRAFEQELEERCDARLRKMFADRPQREKLTEKQLDKLLELFRLGGLQNQNVRDAVVDALGIGSISMAEQNRLLQEISRFADTLDAMDRGDVEGLRTLIRQQAEVRRTKLSRLTEKMLMQESDFDYLYDFALAQLGNIAADFKARSRGQKISTAQTMAHLINVRTALRNVTSNQLFDLIDTAANDVALLPDFLLSKMTGQRTVGFEKSWASDRKRLGARQSARRSGLEISLDVDVEGADRSKYGTGGRRTWSKASGGSVRRFLSEAEKLMGWELNVTDELHKGSVRGEVLDSLARFVERGDLTEEEAMEMAREEALFRSFQDDNLFSSLMAGIKRVLNMVGVGNSGQVVNGKPVKEWGAGDLVLKYTQVPGALISRTIEFSPAGYAKSLYHLVRMVKARSSGERSTADQRRAALYFGRAMTGTGLILLFAALSAAGLLRRGADEKDKNAAALKAAQGLSGTQLNMSGLSRWLSGENPALQERDTLVDIGFLEPLDSLMTIAALVAQEEERNLKTLAKNTLEGIWLALEDTTAMQTVSNLINVVQYHDEENGLPLYFELPLELASSNLSGFVPAPVRQVAQATDTVYREQYATQRVGEQILARLMNTVPGLRLMLPEKLTPLGEAKTYPRRWNLLNATVIPGNVSVYTTTPVIQELERVYAATGEAKIWPERNAPYSIKMGEESFTLTGEERQEYQRLRGQFTTDAMGDVLQEDWYRVLSPTNQAEVLNFVGSWANFVAKKDWAEGRGKTYSSQTYDKVTRALLSGTPTGDVLREKFAEEIGRDEGKQQLVSAGADADAVARLFESFSSNETKAEQLGRILGSGLKGQHVYGAIRALMKNGEKDAQRVQVAEVYNVDFSLYVEAAESIAAHNDNGGSVSQAEAKAGIDAIFGLSDMQRAALWQLQGDWLPKNNPYNVRIGQDVKDAISEPAQASGLVLGG